MPAPAAQDRLSTLLGYVDADPDNPALLADAAEAALDARDPDTAAELIERAAVLATGTPRHTNLAGLAALQRKDFARAAVLFAELFEAGVDDPGLRFNLAWARANLHDYAAALADLDDATARRLAQAAMLRVQLLHQLGQIDEAIESARAYNGLHPDHQGLMAAISVVAIDAEDETLAADAAARAGDHPDALATRGTLALGAQRATEAEAIFARAIARSALLAVTLFLAGAATAQPSVTPMTPDVLASFDAALPAADFVRREAMVPMRDGTRLYTVIVFRKGTRGGPILLSRTPYDAHASANRVASQRGVDVLEVMDAEFFADGYIRVYQDIRGLHRSEGQYVMNRPLAGPLNDTGIDESTDAWDTIDWLVKNVPESNGRVGVIGSSYLGFTTLMAEINPHPALKAAVPESPMVDGWMGDDWFHNGAFRVSGFDYALEQSVDKANAGAKLPLGAGDHYTRYLQAGSAADFAKSAGIERVPGVRKFLENPAYTDFWSLQAVDKWLAARPLTVPTMIELGQWDQEDSYGGPAVYRALEPKDAGNDKVTLVIGPWRHSGANHGGYDLGALTFTGNTAREWRTRYMKPFLDHWLKDAPDPHTPPVLTYTTGLNQWTTSPRWPMGSPKPLYLAANGAAGFEKPAARGHDDYVSDPAHPVPFIPRPIDMADAEQWKPWLVHDQRFVSDRPDVIAWKTAPLDRPVHIMGAPGVDLYAATTGTDSDWVVKLIDVYPLDVPESAAQGDKPSMAGFELPIGIEIFRGRYVRDFARPVALRPGQVERYRWSLPNVDHVFLPGHRIMVQVQSSLFPLYDRNPQTFVPNIMIARPGDYRAATQSIWRGGATASAVTLPVVD